MNPPLYQQRPTAFDLAPAAPGRSFRVNDFIVCSEGMSNAYAIQTDDGRVIVNTGMGFEARAHRENFDAAASLVASGLVVGKPLVTHRVAAPDLSAAYDIVSSHDEEFIQVVLDWANSDL